MKGKFKETGIGQFLTQKLPGAVDHLVDLVPDRGVLGVVKNLIEGSTLSDADKLEANRLLLQEFELEIADRDSARNREIEVLKAGSSDWLKNVAGLTALAVFVLMVISVIFIPGTKDNPLFHQLMGIIEGVTLTIYAFYFGTSKSSGDKNRIIEQLKGRLG